MQTIFKFLLITTFLMSPLVAGAVGYTLLEPLPCIRGNGVTCTTGEQITSPDFKTYVQYLFNLAIAIAAVSAVFMIVWGGFQYMTSEAPGVKSDGLKKVQNAVYGLLLVLSSFIILKTIDPRLVEISSTLVDPLKIKCPTGTDENMLRSDPKCKKDAISDFFTRIADEAERYRVENIATRNNNNALQAKIDAEKTERQALCDKLIVSDRANFVPDPNGLDSADDRYTCDQLLSMQSALDPASKALATQIAKIDSEQKGLQTEQDTNKAIGLMNTHIQICYAADRPGASSNLNVNNCLNKIAEIQSVYVKKLKDNGATVEAQQIIDYGIYAEAITKINTSTLITMSSSPYTKAAIDSLQSVVTAASIGAGAGVGAVVGAGAGAVVGGVAAGVFAKSILKVVIDSENKDEAELAISNIQLEVNNTKDKISNPKIREQFVAQSYSLIKSLGGKGDGTDPIKLKTTPTPTNLRPTKLGN